MERLSISLEYLGTDVSEASTTGVPAVLGIAV